MEHLQTFVDTAESARDTVNTQVHTALRQPSRTGKRLLKAIIARTCLCLSLLLALGLILAVGMYVTWGSIILSDSNGVKGGNTCNNEHIWIFVLVCVVTMAAAFCCCACSGLCEKRPDGTYVPGTFPIIQGTIGLGIFAWGIVQYTTMDESCKRQFSQDFPQLWSFFLASFIIQIVLAFIQIGLFLLVCLGMVRGEPSSLNSNSAASYRRLMNSDDALTSV
mmetsp:Transcript_42143/g.106328  ORF Transcript_42143/g.106328 Transcript_42143/m.106328 type:complete len:221 (+) Transcript_42143:176-838(+)|eukprot:CAMPEP_0177680442 /NCGR_PEP_ID=MMETSP0447-20121125/30174_1 /TAXON_ID=0 /ORGANISM="Stygamoeba regulata, Strain BSH-02190019" /LENGTH=220 /DNA_ID=CAMNT_0019189771 /DNA_START=163 /DNA_END=825 /DNA_ORIENTATION=+